MATMAPSPHPLLVDSEYAQHVVNGLMKECEVHVENLVRDGAGAADITLFLDEVLARADMKEAQNDGTNGRLYGTVLLKRQDASPAIGPTDAAPSTEPTASLTEEDITLFQSRMTSLEESMATLKNKIDAIETVNQVQKQTHSIDKILNLENKLADIDSRLTKLISGKDGSLGTKRPRDEVEEHGPSGEAEDERPVTKKKKTEALALADGELPGVENGGLSSEAIQALVKRYKPNTQ